MTSLQQGANGAETKTAGQIACEAYFPSDPDIWANVTEAGCGEHWERAAAAAINHAALSPRTDGAGAAAGEVTPWKAGQSGYAREAMLLDGEEQALEIAVTVSGRIDLIIHNRAGDGFDDLTARMSREDAGRVVAALVEAGAPAAGQAGAVPDSLRAFVRHCEEKVYPLVVDSSALNGRQINEFVDALNAAREALASHPAGQSTGPGTGEREHAAEMELQEIQDGAYGDNPMVRGLAQDRLTALQGKPAPSSLHMGQKGTETFRLIGPKMTPEQEERIAHNLCGEFGADAVIANAGFVKAFYAELFAAARPAAPEAQGAWRPIETAPKDGTKLLLCVAGYEPAIGGWFEKRWLSFDPESFDHDTLTRWLDDTTYEPTHWQPVPAPPASSGQGGR